VDGGGEGDGDGVDIGAGVGVDVDVGVDAGVDIGAGVGVDVDVGVDAGVDVVLETRSRTAAEVCVVVDVDDETSLIVLLVDSEMTTISPNPIAE